MDTQLAEEAGAVTAKNVRTARFSDAPWFEPGILVIVGGAGGIGSFLSFFLGRQECEIYLFDMDTFEEQNMAGQLVSEEYLERNKAEAMAELIHEFTEGFVVPLGEYNETSMVAPIMFSGFDNMKARATMFENWCKQEDRELFLDGRMSLESGQCFFIQKGMEDRYRSTLFDDKEGDEAPCTFKSTSHCAAKLATEMVAGFNNYITNKKAKDNLRDVPFKQSFDFPLMLNTTIA